MHFNRQQKGYEYIIKPQVLSQLYRIATDMNVTATDLVAHFICLGIELCEQNKEGAYSVLNEIMANIKDDSC